MFCILNRIAFFVGWIVLLVACAVYIIPLLIVSPVFHVVLILYVILSLAVSLIAFFVWWPRNRYRIYLSRVGYSLMAGFKGLWLWVGMVFYFFLAKVMVSHLLKTGESIEDIAEIADIPLHEVYHIAYQANIREFPFSLISYEELFVR
jgi:hypothetical protein